MTETRYAVGWYSLTPAQLQEFPEECREECQSIHLFGNRPVILDSPEEALAFKRQIIQVNSLNNLRALTGVGPEALFIVEVKPRLNRADPWENPHRFRYEPAQFST